MSATSIISHQDTFQHRPTPALAAPTTQCCCKLALVIPTLREAENLRPLLERIRRALDPLDMEYEILIVDDDSCDGTAELVAAMACSDPRVRLLIRRRQRGLAGAVLHGWAHTDASILGVMDADLQHPPELLPELVAAMLSGCDLAVGSRYAPGAALLEWNPLRKMASAIAVWATWPIQRRGPGIRDPLSGFFLVRRECLAGISFQQSGFKLLLEILMRARIGSIREAPLVFGRRLRGSSKANAKVAFDYARLLIGLYLDRLGVRRIRATSFSDSC